MANCGGKRSELRRCKLDGEKESARFSTMEYAQHENLDAVVLILKDIRRAEHLQGELAVLIMARNRTSELRMVAKDVSARDDFFGNSRAQCGELIVKEDGEPIEISERV